MPLTTSRRWIAGSLPVAVLLAANLIVAVSAAAELCCKYKYALRSGPSSDAGPAACEAHQLICQCEVAAIRAPDPLTGKIAISSRLAKRYCYWTTSGLNVKRADCSFTSEGWIKLEPRLDKDPDICCFIKYPSEGTTLTEFTLEAGVDDCNGNFCPNGV